MEVLINVLFYPQIIRDILTIHLLSMPHHYVMCYNFVST